MPAKACTPRVVVALLVILACALALRLYGIGFGLPALLDPDEPLFIISALKLLGQHTLNPGWFGHPGTTTIYSLAIIYASIGGAALASRQFADISSFVAYVYNDPGILVLSGRIFFALCGCACVALTFLLAKRLRSVGTGLLAALLLALNPLHISYSQLIRTDVQSSLFMLLCLLWTCRIVTNGGRRDYVIAGIWAGCACVTKWPAGVVDISLITAAVMRLRDHPSEARNQTCNLVIGLLVSLVTVVTVSPYLLLDYPVLLDNLRGEIQPDHVGASGGGFLANVAWYITGPLRGAIGVMGLLLAFAGIGLAVRKSRVLTATVLPCATVSFVIICANTLIWERWLVPLLPFVAIFEAWALLSLANWLRGATSKRTASFIVAAACAILLIPGLATTRLNANERTNDTRTLAAQWVLHHTSPGTVCWSSILPLIYSSPSAESCSLPAMSDASMPRMCSVKSCNMAPSCNGVERVRWLTSEICRSRSCPPVKQISQFFRIMIAIAPSVRGIRRKPQPMSGRCASAARSRSSCQSREKLVVPRFA